MIAPIASPNVSKTKMAAPVPNFASIPSVASTSGTLSPSQGPR